MKTTLRLAAAGLLLLLTTVAWCQVVPTKISIKPGHGWGSSARVHDVDGGASVFSFAIAAGRRRHSINPKVTIHFAANVWDQTPVCHLSQGWSIDSVSEEKLRIHWNGKPRAGEVISASVTCSD